MRFNAFILSTLLVFGFVGLNGCEQGAMTAESRDARNVSRQQAQYAKGQPVPHFDWSLERNLLIQLYQVRNQKVTTHSVWRSDHGMIEGDCPSLGYGLPYDTSLTNPLRTTSVDEFGNRHVYDGAALVTIEQAEPNGIFASKNTAATWVLCVEDDGSIAPVYVETKVTVYPGQVKVDYDKNRVTRFGEPTVTMTK